MGRRFLLAVAISLSGVFSASSLAQSARIRFVDEAGKTVVEADAVAQEGRLYFSVETLRDAFDTDLRQQYGSLTKSLTLHLREKQLRMQVGASAVTVDPDGKRLYLSPPPLMTPEGPMLPLQFFTELIPQVYNFEAQFNPVLGTLQLKERATLFPHLPQEPSASGKQTGTVVIIDPGHGGDDTGCRGAGGALEKDVVLNLARRVEAALLQHNVRVLLTRNSDAERKRKERTDVAQRNRGQLFLSLHCNASFSPEIEGIRLYVNNAWGRLQLESLSRAASPTMRMATLSQEDFLTQSRDLASHLQRELTPFSRSPITVAEIPLAALSSVYMPAALLEVGYLSNPADEARLTNAESLALIAAAISQAIQNYIAASNPAGEVMNGQPALR
jgi:N-acetylmuramoyl-L-alanine amidase